jgi:hypothetical protein
MTSNNRCRISYLIILGCTFFLFCSSSVSTAMFMDRTYGPIMAESYDMEHTGSIQELLTEHYPVPQDIQAVLVHDSDSSMVIMRWRIESDDIQPDFFLIEMQVNDTDWMSVGQTTDYKLNVNNIDKESVYRFRVAASYDDLLIRSYTEIEPVIEDQWFKFDELPVMVAVFVFTVLLCCFLWAAKQGQKLHIRRIPGLNAVDKANGVSEDVHKLVLYVLGCCTMENVITLAVSNVSGAGGHNTAAFELNILGSDIDTIIFSVAREIIRDACYLETHPEAFDVEQVFFVRPEQYAFTASSTGIIIREQPFTMFLMGMFWAESLILGKTGAISGVIQISETDQASQLPFFITASDYTLISEELYATSSYLSLDPMRIGAMKAQDYSKLLFVILMILFTVIALITGWDTSQWVTVR